MNAISARHSCGGGNMIDMQSAPTVTFSVLIDLTVSTKTFLTLTSSAHCVTLFITCSARASLNHRLR